MHPTTTPSFNEVFSAYKKIVDACEAPDPATLHRPRAIPIGDWGIVCFAFQHLSNNGMLRPSVEEEDLEHTVRKMDILLETGHLPTFLKNQPGEMRDDVYHLNVPINSGNPSAPMMSIPAQLHLSSRLVSELVAPAHHFNFGDLIFLRIAQTTRRTNVWQFKSIVLVLLELLAWHDDRHDRHLVNIKVLFSAETDHARGGVNLENVSLNENGIHSVAHLLSQTAVQRAIGVATLVEHQHAAAAAQWEYRNFPGIKTVQTLQALTQEWRGLLRGLRDLLQHFHTVAHADPEPDYSAWLTEHSVGRRERKSRRRSFASGRGGW
ncbi:hypothetical protein JCM6882_003863 [Rhodosporidiobolus microsporus]